MSISSSLNAGVAGLSANATKLGTIADNISNSGTYGYKRVRTDFEGMVISQARGAGTYSAGGVRAMTSRIIDERGALISTKHPLDLAVSGRGMLPVIPATSMGSNMSTTSLLMTTTGGFRTDANGVLKTESGLVLMGWPANADGNIDIMPRDTIGGLQPVVISANQTASDPTTHINLGINLPATDTYAGSTGQSLPIKVEYFGNLGTSEALSITFTPNVDGDPGSGMTNTWTMEIRDSAIDISDDEDANIVGTYTVTFQDDQSNGGRIQKVEVENGGAYDAETGNLSLELAGGPVTVNIGRPLDQNGLSQLGDTFTQNITKNGSPVGNLTGVEVDERGLIIATYDTGFIRTIYQIPLVDVPNPNALTALNNQTFKVSPESGSFFLWDAGDGPTGAIVGYAREGSTTDVAAELTELIQTQRAYSSNAKVIQTVDEMLQETTNIKR
ncbi:MAG: flagellar hook-basal body complex protein [Paracoccus sp. (in: a-proteobacteria)]|uniref:flagellar hook protein FlgE n=1 Tax=Paracoccus sp. TaxID=267 RepID=UPI0026E02CE9|nr:flagellar hook-basal body complex protein [Paracoccus sp. (in: a-proteobacteria)]MDO5620888.1 flagellar hook-basal body complex protein [Paracoccus sp. (in: a-proteobacteria)]